MNATQKPPMDSKSLHVSDRMRRSTDVLLHPDHSLREAFVRMREKNLTFAPVVDGDSLVGVLSVSQLPRRARKTPHDRERLAVRDRMETTVPFLYETDPLALGAAIASNTGIAHFCVVDRKHHLIGTVSFENEAASPGPTKQETIAEATVRRRLAVTPSRATESPPGDVGSYSAGPVLHVRDILQPNGAIKPTK